MMIKIEAIVREEVFEDVKEALNAIDVNGITVSQVMGNYLKTLKDNKIAQAWTRRQDVVQPAGLVGPVTAYRIKN